MSATSGWVHQAVSRGTTARMDSAQLTIGSLFTGAGMLDRAAEEVFDARTVWVSDVDKGACKVLAHRYPDAPGVTRSEALKMLGNGVATPQCVAALRIMLGRTIK